MAAYYSEIDPFCCEWLRNLIKKGLITDGEVDGRDIRDVVPEDVRGFQRAHFFAGIGGWDYALRLAGWAEDRPVWTGSCPCQSFSQAGKRKGFADERHLWPSFFHLIQYGKSREVPVFGEQVASPDALAWLDLVQADMEGEGHTVWAADLCAAGVGAPIIRQRLWWVAFAPGSRYVGRGSGLAGDGREETWEQSERLCDASGMVLPNGWNSFSEREQRFEQKYGRVGKWLAQPPGGGRGEECPNGGGVVEGDRKERDSTGSESGGDTKWLGVPSHQGLQERAGVGGIQREEMGASERETFISTSNPYRDSSPPNSFWSSPDWILCRDGKWRPVEPGTQPLATGISNRVGQLRGYGNSIVPQVATEFIKAWMDCQP